MTAAPVAAPAPAAYNDGKASDDLLQLAGNPFANMLNGRFTDFSTLTIFLFFQSQFRGKIIMQNNMVICGS